jgi:hypothetical protein
LIPCDSPFARSWQSSAVGRFLLCRPQTIYAPCRDIGHSIPFSASPSPDGQTPAPYTGIFLEGFSWFLLRALAGSGGASDACVEGIGVGPSRKEAVISVWADPRAQGFGHCVTLAPLCRMLTAPSKYI